MSHRFEWVLLVLSLLIIPVVLVEESHGPPWLKDGASVANWVIWTGFFVELAAILILAPRKRAALRAHWLEAAIVIITPPFLPGLFSAFRAARLIRLLRLARLGVLGARVIRAEQVITSRAGFRYVALTTALLVIISGAAISVADSKDFSNIGVGIWWAVTTVTTVGYGDVVPTTVGYGDVVPTTVGGRIVASILMIVGIGFISILTATIASSFVARDVDDAESVTLTEVMAALQRIEARLATLEDDRPG